jgi:hypothetical protein
MEEQKPQTQRKHITIACFAKTYLDDGKIGLVFREIAEDGSLGDERIYRHKGLEHLRIGATYEVEIDVNNPRSIYTKTLRWLRLWDKAHEAAAWQLASDAFDTRHLALRQEKKQNARKLPVELLAPIRDEYRRTNYLGRLAIEVRVLAYLRQIKVSPAS